ncbi:MAG: hypothetical protein K2K24_03745 [Clostridia bacterium]|nr:hypothetical protein [Clostridia bacterium]
MSDKKPVKEHTKEHAKEHAPAANKETKQKVKTAEPNTVRSNRLKLLITIVARKKADYYADLIQSFDVNMQMIVLAEGTANANMLGLLGLVDNEKAVILGVIQENKVPDAMNALEEKFQTIKDGKGVACTVPLTSVIGTLIYGFLSNNRRTVKESKK